MGFVCYNAGRLRFNRNGAGSGAELLGDGWRIDFLGPTTYLANTAGFHNRDDGFPQALTEQMPPEVVEQMEEVTSRFDAIAGLLDGDRVHLPFTVVHAHRVD